MKRSLILLLLCGCAQNYSVQDIYNKACKVTCKLVFEKDGELSSAGTGVLVKNMTDTPYNFLMFKHCYLIFTGAHVIKQNNGAYLNIHTYSYNRRGEIILRRILREGEHFLYTYITGDNDAGIVLIFTDIEMNFKEVNICKEKPRLGEEIIVSSCPNMMDPVITNCKLARLSIYDEYDVINCVSDSGSSGGPVFNIKGELLGIVTAKYSRYSCSVGFALGITNMHSFYDLIKENEDLVNNIWK